MYMCFRDINEVCIPGQKSERSCVCLLGISVKCVYQARRGGSHIYMFYGYQSSVYTRPGEGAVMYMCFREINLASVAMVFPLVLFLMIWYFCLFPYI